MPKLPVVFFPQKKTYYWYNDYANLWQPSPAETIETRLKAIGFASIAGRGASNSPLKLELERIQREDSVDAVASLGWETTGIKDIEGQKILVYRGCTLTEAVPGLWPTIKTVLDNLLGPEQLPYFLGWLSSAVRGLYNKGPRMYGQAVVFCGPSGCGKSLVQDHVITPVLGGKCGLPFDWLSGGTTFNSELFQACPLKIEDEYYLGDQGSRKAFGSALKKITANQEHKLHEKGLPAFTTKPYWRLSISLNDEPDNVAVLPNLEPSLEGKLIIFACDKHPMPYKVGELEVVMRAEIPAFLDYLLNHHTIPEALVDARYGVKAYIHTKMREALEDEGIEKTLFEYLETMFRGKLVEHNETSLLMLMEGGEPPRALDWLLKHPPKLRTALRKLCAETEQVKHKRYSNRRVWQFNFS